MSLPACGRAIRPDRTGRERIVQSQSLFENDLEFEVVMVFLQSRQAFDQLQPPRVRPFFPGESELGRFGPGHAGKLREGRIAEGLVLCLGEVVKKLDQAHGVRRCSGVSET